MQLFGSYRKIANHFLNWLALIRNLFALLLLIVQNFSKKSLANPLVKVIRNRPKLIRNNPKISRISWPKWFSFTPKVIRIWWCESAWFQSCKQALFTCSIPVSIPARYTVCLSFICKLCQHIMSLDVPIEYVYILYNIL